MVRFLIGFIIICSAFALGRYFPLQLLLFIIMAMGGLVIFFLSSIVGDAVVWAWSSLLKKLRK